MDTLTHALSGALVARATQPRAGGALPTRTRVAVGLLAAAFPDSDVVLSLVDPMTYLTAHRGVTHSLVLLPFWAATLGWLFYRLYRRRYPWAAFAGVCAWSLATHIAGDVITSFGTMILAPLSGWRAQIPAVFIIDPWFTGIIAAGLLASWLRPDTRLPARMAAAVLAGYVGMQVYNHARAVDIGEAQIAAAGLAPARAHALPQPLSPFHWMIVLELRDAYRLGYVSLVREEIPPVAPRAGWLRHVYASYRPVEHIAWREVPRFGASPEDRPLVHEAWRSPVLAPYRRFAMFPALYRLDRSATRTCVWFHDLRFALVGRTVPFRFGACRSADGAPWRLFQLRGGGAGAETLLALD
jgi:inner membrane protein